MDNYEKKFKNYLLELELDSLFDDGSKVETTMNNFFVKANISSRITRDKVNFKVEELGEDGAVIASAKGLNVDPYAEKININIISKPSKGGIFLYSFIDKVGTWEGKKTLFSKNELSQDEFEEGLLEIADIFDKSSKLDLNL